MTYLVIFMFIFMFVDILAVSQVCMCVCSVHDVHNKKFALFLPFVKGSAISCYSCTSAAQK